MRNHERESCTVVPLLEESIFLAFFLFVSVSYSKVRNKSLRFHSPRAFPQKNYDLLTWISRFTIFTNHSSRSLNDFPRKKSICCELVREERVSRIFILSKDSEQKFAITIRGRDFRNLLQLPFLRRETALEWVSRL